MPSELINRQEIIQAADECVMCGLCLPHCPTYEVAKLEPESPRGRIALVRGLCEGHLQIDKTIHAHLDHCLTCLNCETVCPANVDYKKIITAGRTITYSQRSIYQTLKKYFFFLFITKHYFEKKLKTFISTLRFLNA